MNTTTLAVLSANLICYQIAIPLPLAISTAQLPGCHTSGDESLALWKVWQEVLDAALSHNYCISSNYN